MYLFAPSRAHLNERRRKICFPGHTYSEIFVSHRHLPHRQQSGCQHILLLCRARCVRTQTDAPTAAEFTMDAAGVYLVKVGDRPARRIVIVR